MSVGWTSWHFVQWVQAELELVCINTLYFYAAKKWEEPVLGKKIEEKSD